jgi:hypothetical protein
LIADFVMNAGSTGAVGGSTRMSLITATGQDHLSFAVAPRTGATMETGIFAELVGTTRHEQVIHTEGPTVVWATPSLAARAHDERTLALRAHAAIEDRAALTS